MKKGQKPTGAQTATLRAINVFKAEVKRLKKLSTIRKLHIEERVEGRVLLWVLLHLGNKDEEELAARPSIRELY